MKGKVLIRLLFLFGLVGLIIFSTLLFVGCDKQSDKDKIDITKMSASEIVAVFVNAGYPIGNVVDYTETTDLNKMLGRPGSYISKTSFADTRLEQLTIADASPVGGTVEVFNNSSDADKRIAYIHGLVGQPGVFFQYEYSYKNVYFRIAGTLTPNQALQYEQAFKSLTEGTLPQTYVEWDE